MIGNLDFEKLVHGNFKKKIIDLHTEHTYTAKVSVIH